MQLMKLPHRLHDVPIQIRKSLRCRGLALLLGLVLGFPAHAAQPMGCLIEPNQVVELGSPVIGVLERVNVDRGAAIRKGQVLATLKADVERAASDVAKSRAQAEADVQAAIANRDYNRQRLTRAQELVKQNFIAKQALDQSVTEADVAEQRLAQAREQKRTWDREYDMARAQLNLRSLISPLNGIVVDRYLHPGERVEDRAVLKIAALNPLRVEVFMPAASYRDVKVGMLAKVYPELPDAGEHRAKVILVDRIIDPASNTFRVRLELPNPGNALPAGLRCKAAIGEQVIGAASDPNKAVVPAVLAPAPSGVAKPVQPPLKAAPAPVKSLPAPKTGAMPVDEGVLQALENWRKSWASRDLTGYIAAYAPSFRGGSPTREAWIKQREARLRQADNLVVRVSDAQVRVIDDKRARVHFRQHYQASGYRDVSLKTLSMVLEKDQWLIQDELSRQ
jgi:membrane fusion protein, heavy metal efflux system